MQYRRLGRSGLQVSALSFGSWVTFGSQVDVDLARRLLAAAREAGVNFFDNAEAYAAGESERIMGQAIRDLGWARDSFVVSSKVFFGLGGPDWPTQRGLCRKHVVEACHQALQRLQVDHLDLYFCHRPDPATPIGETVLAMHDLVQQGKVLYWGTSEWSAKQITEAFVHAEENGLTPPTMEQPQYNMLFRYRVEIEYAHLYRRFGLGTTTWSPLRSGILSGKYRDGIPADSRANVPGYEWIRDNLQSPTGQAQIALAREIGAIADDLGVSSAQLAIAWCLRNPDVSTVILGASRESQLHENLAALDVVTKLDASVMARIEGCLRRAPCHRALRSRAGRWLAQRVHAFGLR